VWSKSDKSWHNSRVTGAEKYCRTEMKIVKRVDAGIEIINVGKSGNSERHSSSMAFVSNV
jgi:hypothetical protein